jgi:hypothetical protein
MIANLDATKITTGFLDTNRLAANSLDASKINTRGLDIRDAAGNVVFSSGANGPNYVAFVASPGVALVGNTATCKGVENVWNAQLYSKDAYVGGAFASGVMASGANAMFGLTTDPLTNASYDSIDYAIHTSGNGNLYAYENGTGTAISSSWAIGDALAVVYDGSYVRYLQNGQVRRTVAVAANLVLYFDSSWATAGDSVANIRFGPYGNPSAVQPSNPINSGNVSTYIANAAIQNAQIGDAQITNAKISGDIQSDNFASGSSGWRIRKSDGSAEFAAASIRDKLTTNQLEVGSVTANAVTSQSAAGAVLANSATEQLLIGPSANNALLTMTLNGGHTRVTAVWTGSIAVAKSSTIAYVTCDCAIEVLDEANNVLDGYANSAYSSRWARASAPIIPDNSTAINKTAEFSFTIQFMISGQSGVRKFRLVLFRFRGVNTSGALAAPGTSGVMPGIGTIIAQEHRV